MQMATKEPAEESPPSKPTTAKAPTIASVPVPGWNEAHDSVQLLGKAAITRLRGRTSHRSEQTPRRGWWHPEPGSTVREWRPRTAIDR